MQKKFIKAATSGMKKLALVSLGIILTLVLLEAGLHLGGSVQAWVQKYEYLRAIKQKGAYRILSLGECTTAEYPRFLEQVLNRRNIGVRFWVRDNLGIDKGFGGMKTSFILSRVESYLAEYHPDMVIAMMGINDNGVQSYEALSKSDTWLFRYCRLYRFGRTLYGHILKKITRENIRGSSGSDPGRKAKPKDVRTISEKTVLFKEMLAKKVIKPDSQDVAKSLGQKDLYPNGSRLSEPEKPANAIPLDPRAYNAYVGSGWLGLEQGNLSQAEDALKKGAKTNPKSDHASMGSGAFSQVQGQFSQAEDSLKKAIGLDPENDNACLALANFYRLRNQFSQADNFYRKAIRINPKNDGAYAELGWLYLNENLFPEANGFLRKAIDLNPKNNKAYAGLGRLYREQGKSSQAEDLYKQAIENNPGDLFAFFELVGLYRKENKLSAAEDFLRKAIDLDPKNENLWGAIATLYEEMGKPTLAKEYADKLNRLRSEYYDPVLANNHRRLKEILDKKGIKLVCVQYPMRNIEPLKRIFAEDKGVIFVENESVFKKAVRQGSYREYFNDMFADDFGHFTQKSVELLAQNIAEVILKEVFGQ